MTNRPSEIVTKNKAFLDLQVDTKDDSGNERRNVLFEQQWIFFT